VREKRLKTSLLPYLHNNAKKLMTEKKQQINILRFLQASGAARIEYFANRLIFYQLKAINRLLIAAYRLFFKEAYPGNVYVCTYPTIAKTTAAP